MGVAAGGATLEIQLVADVARLKRDMAEMRQAVATATAGATDSFQRVGASSAQAATQMAAAAQASARAAVGMGGGMRMMGGSSQLAAHHLSNLSFQLNDIAVGFASGQKPMTIFMQQGMQIAQIMQQAGTGVKGFIKAAAEMTGIIKVTTDAEAAFAAQTAAAAAASIKSQADRAAATVMARNTQVAMAQAELAAATSAEAQAIAQEKLVKAYRTLEVATGRAVTAQQALATAQAEAAATADAAAAKTVTRMGRVGAILTGVGIAAAFLGSAFAGVKAQAEGTDAELKEYINTLGLTDKEMKKLKDTHVTWGDTAKATFMVLAERAGVSIEGIKDAWGRGWKFITDFGRFSIAVLLAAFGAMIEGVISLFSNLPGIIGNAVVAGVNIAITAIEKLLNTAASGLNFLIDSANSAFGLGLGRIGDVSLPRLEAQFKGSFANIGADVKKRFYGTYQDVQSGFDKISKVADGLRDKRLKDQAAEMIKDRTAKKAAKEKADAAQKELDLLDKQIEGQWRLVDAYMAGDAAAMRAEARLKAEEKALQKKGEVEAFYVRELALAVAQRAADGAKEIGNLRAETDLRKQVNDQLAAGNISAAEAGRMLQTEQKLRPLIAAAANAEGDAKKKILEVIEALRGAQAGYNTELAREAALREISKNDEEIAKLRLETELIGASNRERAIRLAQLEAEQFIAKNNVAPQDQAAVIRSYIDAADAANTLREGQAGYNIELNATLEMLRLLDEQTQLMAQSMADAFGPVGEAIGGVLANLTAWQVKEQEIMDWKKEQLKEVAAGSAAAAAIEAQAAKKSAAAQTQAIGMTLTAAKSMFKEKSAGYKVLSALEKAYAVLQIVNTVKSIAMDATHTASSVANSATRAAADQAAGASKIFAQLGVWAFPVVAAMIGLLAALGVGGGGGGSSAPSVPSAEDVQAAQGAGTVLGDSSAKSQSIVNSLNILAENSTRGLDYTGDMVRSLRKIESSIGSLANAVARSLQISGGFFDPSTMNLGTSGSSGFLGLFGSSKTKTLYDQGFKIDGASLATILESGISGATYNVIETVKKKSGFLGIGGGTKTKYSTKYGDLPDDVARQFQLIIGDLYDTVVASAKVLGFDVGEALKTFQVEIGKISFKDLKGDEINQALEAVFSKIGDQMAGFAVAGLEKFQKAGEGLFETLNRLAMEYLTIDMALKSIGLTFGAVGASSLGARSALIELMGGLDEFVNQINYYYDNFLSQAEQTAFLQEQVDAAFAAMGISTPSTIAQFKALVEAQDLTTEAGQAMFAQLMAVAPAFYELETAAQQAAEAAAQAAEQLAKQKKQLQIDLLEAQGKAEEALAMKRQMILDGMDASLRALQKEVWLAQDVAKAKDALSQAYQRESRELEATITRFRRFASDLREFRDSLFANDGSPLSYNQAMAKLIAQGALAATGDEGALGGGLRSAATSFLDVATANARTLADVQRARALVARTLDDAIGGAENQATIAEQQLDQLKDQVSALISIDEHVLTVAEAIADLNALLGPASVTPPVGGGGGGNSDDDGLGGRKNREETERRRQEREERIEKILEQNTVSANKVARIFDRADRGGAIAIVTDSDLPIHVDNGLDLA